MSGSSDERGFLTESDRDYLRGEVEYAQPAGERRKRGQIRERTRKALEDFGLLHQHLECRDVRQIQSEFAEREDESYARATGEEPLIGADELVWDYLLDPDVLHYAIFSGGIRSTQAFLGLLLLDFCEEFELSEQQFEGLFGELAERGLRDAYGRLDQVVDATVDVEIQTLDVDIEALRSKFEENPQDLSEDEVERLIHLREVTWEEYDEYLDEFHRSGEGD